MFSVHAKKDVCCFLRHFKDKKILTEGVWRDCQAVGYINVELEEGCVRAQLSGAR